MHKYAASYIKTAKQIIQAYSPEIPFASFIKQFFVVNKKYGSKDRKAISQACYSYFRLGKTVKTLNLDDAILIGIFLSEKDTDNWQLVFPDNWIEIQALDLTSRIEFLISQRVIDTNFNPFYFTKYLSDKIDAAKFGLSHLQQPLSFIRIRPKFENKIKLKLQNQQVSYRIEATSIGFEENINIENIALLNKEVVVQDFSSQQIANLLQLIPPTNGTLKVWDCCAASGGKSILAADVLGKIELTVSDIRETILYNLKKRLAVAQIPIYNLQVKDLSKAQKNNETFDVIMADVPCTGSGTWGRTPENLVFFNEEKITEFKQIQQKIISNTVISLKKGGYYLFITCSVFAEENEENVAFIQEKLNLQLIKQQYFIGIDKKADTLFGALFYKNE